MSAAGLLASWLALVFGGWSFVAALGASAARPALHDSARRGLWMAAAGAAAAAVILGILLLEARLEVSYVARHISLNLPRADRLAAVLSAPGGAALAAAALVAAAGAWRARSSALGISVTAATVVALLASSVAAPPFARLDWLPADGMGMSPSMQESATVWSRVLLVLLLTGAAMAAAVAADMVANTMSDAARGATEDAREAGLIPRRALDRVTTTTGAAAALAIALEGEGGLLSGMSTTSAPLEGVGALLLVPLIAAVMARRTRRASASGGLLGCVGLLGSAMVAILGMGSSTLPAPLLALASASLGAAALGAIDADLGRPMPVARILGVLSSAALGAAGALILAANGGEPALSPAALPMALAVSLVSSGMSASLVRQGVAAAHSGWRTLLVAGCVGLGAAFAWLPDGGEGTTVAVWWGIVAGAAAGSALASFPPSPAIRSPEAWRGVAAGFAVALAALAATGESLGRGAVLRLTSGESREIERRFGPPLRVTHQGVSRYQGVNAHIVALAMELSGDGAPALVTSERHEFVDTREAPLGEPVARPGIFGGALEEVRLRLEEVAPDESVALSVVSVPFAGGWRLAALGAVVVAALSWLAPRVRSPAMTNDGSLDGSLDGSRP